MRWWYIAWPDSAPEAFDAYPSCDGAPGTVSSSRRRRRSRFSAGGFGRAGVRETFLRAAAFFAAGRRLLAAAAARGRDAALADFRRGRAVARLVRERADFFVLRAAFRVRAFALRFAITDVLSLTVYP
jgi:hypothetical protein